MWNRAEVKIKAKAELKQSYWLSFAVCLVGAILIGASGSFSSSSAFTNGLVSGSNGSDLGMDPAVLAAILAVAGVALIIAFAAGVAYAIFLSNPVAVGVANFFIRAPKGDRQFTHLFSSFKSGHYMSAVKAMFFMYLYIFLWSLLFIIPGIIKYYQYRMVPYIISEDPSLSPSEALRLSARMTVGEKWGIFVLDLSFLGWILLGMLAFGIGVLFVVPYLEATYAQLYLALKPKAITGE